MDTISIVALTSRLNEQPESRGLMKPHVIRALIRALAQDPVSHDELNRMADKQRLYNHALREEAARGPAVQIVDEQGLETWNPQFARRLEQESPTLFRQLVAQKAQRLGEQS